MKIESKLIKDLKPATYNPRQISTKQFKDLKESIEKFTLCDPIIINKDMTVIGGHQRFKAHRNSLCCIRFKQRRRKGIEY